MAEFSDAKSGAYCMCTRERCSDECRTYRQFHPKPVTNADRVRAMSDEELAEFMWAGCDNITQEACKSHAGCVNCWLDWLKEVTDG